MSGQNDFESDVSGSHGRFTGDVDVPPVRQPEAGAARPRVWGLIAWAAGAVAVGAVFAVPVMMLAQLVALGRVSGDWTSDEYGLFAWIAYTALAVLPIALPGVFNIVATVVFVVLARGKRGILSVQGWVWALSGVAVLPALVLGLLGPEAAVLGGNFTFVLMGANAVGWALMVAVWGVVQRSRLKRQGGHAMSGAGAAARV
jgi:hypothetical protein